MDDQILNAIRELNQSNETSGFEAILAKVGCRESTLRSSILALNKDRKIHFAGENWIARPA